MRQMNGNLRWGARSVPFYRLLGMDPQPVDCNPERRRAMVSVR